MKLATSLMQRRPRLADLAQAGRLPFALRWATASYADFLRWITSDLRLRAVLAANLGALGVPPSQASVPLALGMFLHFQDGAYFPRGGGAGLRDALIAAAEKDGAATFRTKAEVKRIVLRGGVARGVVLADGELLEADAVISAVEPQVTYGRLIDLAELPWRLCRKVAYTEPSLGSLYVFLGLRRDLTEHGFGAFNVWEYLTYDLDGLYREAQQGILGGPKAFIASPNSLKDLSGKLAPEGCSTMEVMTFAPYEPFARWDGLRSERRGPAYEELKQRCGEELLAAFEEAHPGVVGDVEVKTFATPVTNSYWVGAVKGGAYGPAMTREQTLHRRFRTKTPFAGLYLAGSGVLGCGVATCLLSGKVAANLAAKQLRSR